MDTLETVNVQSIAIQVPIKSLTVDGKEPSDMTSPKSVIGVWATASRRKVRMFNGPDNESSEAGPWVQVSRLGNPLFNEVIVPMARKDEWNAREPSDDASFLSYVQHPELAGLLPVLYPGVFPELEKLRAAREDLVAIFLTGLPLGVLKVAPDSRTTPARSSPTCCASTSL